MKVVHSSVFGLSFALMIGGCAPTPQQQAAGGGGGRGSSNLASIGGIPTAAEMGTKSGISGLASRTFKATPATGTCGAAPAGAPNGAVSGCTEDTSDSTRVAYDSSVAGATSLADKQFKPGKWIFSLSYFDGSTPPKRLLSSENCKDSTGAAYIFGKTLVNGSTPNPVTIGLCDDKGVTAATTFVPTKANVEVTEEREKKVSYIVSGTDGAKTILLSYVTDKVLPCAATTRSVMSGGTTTIYAGSDIVLKDVDNNYPNVNIFLKKLSTGSSPNEVITGYVSDEILQTFKAALSSAIHKDSTEATPVANVFADATDGATNFQDFLTQLDTNASGSDGFWKFECPQ